MTRARLNRSLQSSWFYHRAMTAQILRNHIFYPFPASYLSRSSPTSPTLPWRSSARLIPVSTGCSLLPSFSPTPVGNISPRAFLPHGHMGITPHGGNPVSVPPTGRQLFTYTAQGILPGVKEILANADSFGQAER